MAPNCANRCLPPRTAGVPRLKSDTPVVSPARTGSRGAKKGTKKEPRRAAWLKLTLSVYHLAARLVQVDAAI